MAWVGEINSPLYNRGRTCSSIGSKGKEMVLTFGDLLMRGGKWESELSKVEIFLDKFECGECT